MVKANEFGFSGEVYIDVLPEGRKAIGTHSGSFHSDETLSVSLLRTLPEYRDHVIVRTRNMDILNKCDIVVDVGGEYDLEKKRFDHHQKGFAETFDESHKTKLSSAGLIYKHFGRSIIESVLGRSLSEEDMNYVYQNTYDHFVEEIDGNDNGIDAYTGSPQYKVTTTISSRVSRLGISWTEEYSEEKELERFRLAMGMVFGEFTQRVHHEVDEILPARSIVKEALDAAETVHPSKAIIVIEKSCPYMEHIFDIEKERGIEGQTKFILVHNTDGSWRVRAMSLNMNTYALRKQILPKCLGMRDQELSDACGIPGCVFVHINGFIGINKTKEGALQMAIQSLSFV